MMRVEDSKLWASIEHLAVNARRKIAAVAYVSDNSRIWFGRGDTLIVDASDEQIASGATSARVLADAVARGAKVYSLPSLHAKLMVFDNTTVIGSANISQQSASTLREAGIISDSPQLVGTVLSLIDNLKEESERVNKRFLRRVSRIAVRRTGPLGPWSKGRLAATTKPTLQEALHANSPHLDDFVFMLVEGEATLTNARIRKAAKKQQKKIPPSDKWDWYQFDTGKYFDDLFQRLFVNQGLKLLSLRVESNHKAVQRAVELMPYSLVYVNHLHIGKTIAFNCIMDYRAPFKLDGKSRKAFCAELTRSLQDNPSLGRKLFRSKSWIFRAKDLPQIFQAGS